MLNLIADPVTACPVIFKASRVPLPIHSPSMLLVTVEYESRSRHEVLEVLNQTYLSMKQLCSCKCRCPSS